MAIFAYNSRRMKRIIAVLLLIMCSAVVELEARPRLRSCDLVFTGQCESSAGSMDEAIAYATSDPGETAYTHVAVIERRWFSLWVIDATPVHGVSRRRFSSFVSELAPGTVMTVKRLNCTSMIRRRNVIRYAKSFLWQPYDFTFLPENGMMYCSELVYECYRTIDGGHLFDSSPMNFLAPDGTLPEYWHELFESMDAEVPQGIPGTNPQDMSSSPHLETVASLVI